MKRSARLRRDKQLRRRIPLKAMSDKRRKDIPRRRAAKAEVLQVWGSACLLRGVEGAGACFGPVECHEVRKASQGGRYDVDNGRPLCRSHNQRLESDAGLAAIARRMGLVKRRGDA